MRLGSLWRVGWCDFNLAVGVTVGSTSVRGARSADFRWSMLQVVGKGVALRGESGVQIVIEYG